ncbi:MAG: hypothetical protein ACYDHM_05940 [Acidiferrobacterales bacterium]
MNTASCSLLPVHAQRAIATALKPLPGFLALCVIGLVLGARSAHADSFSAFMTAEPALAGNSYGCASPVAGGGGRIRFGQHWAGYVY